MKKLLLFALFLLDVSLLFCQGANALVSLSYSGRGGYSLVERTNLRRYVNGKYVGLTSREVRSFVSPSLPQALKYKTKNSPYAKDQWYDGSFYVMEETLRNNQAVSAGVHEAVQSVFHIAPNGTLTMYKDNGYPSYRSFPAYTTEKINPGDSWQASAERSVDPLNKGVFTRMQMLVMYTFSGSEIYKEQEVYRIKATWQTNYGSSDFDPKGDSSLTKATGGHKADIIVLKSTGEAILIIDNTDETFFYADGSQVNFKGTITLFTEFPPAVDTEKIVTALNRVASVKGGESNSNSRNAPPGANGAFGTPPQKPGESMPGGAKPGTPKSGTPLATRKGVEKTLPPTNSNSEPPSPPPSALEQNGATYKNNMVVEKTPAGLRLSVRDIKFKADSDEILASEKSRLDEIAQVLSLAPESKFLIEGHTASVGKPEGEQKLSVARAKRIAQELSARGITGDRFICRGWGGNKPIANNDSDAGRAQNRRVEITILE